MNHFTPIHLGSAAVYLFFMLSGYWVSRMWDKEYAPTSAPYRFFMISRIWRLMPVYYVALLLLLLINVVFRTTDHIGAAAGTGSAAAHFWWSQLFIFGYATLPAAGKLIHPVWSLDIELQFYLVAPFLIALFARYPLFSWPRLSLYALALGGLVAYVRFFGGDPESAYLPMYLIFFLIGLHSARHEWQPSPRLALGGLAVALALMAGSVVLPATRKLLVYSETHGAMAGYTVDFNIVLALLIAAYAMATVRKDPAKGTWLAKVDRDLSSLSYEVYLLHVMALSLVTRLFGHLSRHDRLPIILLAWVALLPASWLVYRYLDKPIDRLRTAWVRSRKRSLKAPEVIYDGTRVRQVT